MFGGTVGMEAWGEKSRTGARRKKMTTATPIAPTANAPRHDATIDNPDLKARRLDMLPASTAHRGYARTKRRMAQQPKHVCHHHIQLMRVLSRSYESGPATAVPKSLRRAANKEPAPRPHSPSPKEQAGQTHRFARC